MRLTISKLNNHPLRQSSCQEAPMQGGTILTKLATQVAADTWYDDPPVELRCGPVGREALHASKRPKTARRNHACSCWQAIMIDCLDWNAMTIDKPVARMQ